MGQAKRRGSFAQRRREAVLREHESAVIASARREPLPGCVIVTEGNVEAGDHWFFDELAVWMPVPKSAVGTPIGVRRVMRGTIDMRLVDTSHLGRHN